MHEEYFGFSEKPFSLTPDPKYLYKSETHANAFDLLQYAIRRREGFVVVTGDIGTGKTTLCRALLDELDRKTFTALVLNPFLSEEDLLRLVLQDFGVVSREEIKRGRLAGVSKQELIDTLNEFLLSLLPLGAGALLIIDEAQNLPRPVLEQIRVLSNLETNKEKLLQIVLVGQLNLKDLLRSSDLRQLDQRVSIRYELRPLTPEETSAYIAHRLTIAGGGVAVSFAPKAIDLVHKFTGGIPRLINLICDRALLGGYSARTNRITPEMVKTAAAGLDLKTRRIAALEWVHQRVAGFAAGVAVTGMVAVGMAYAMNAGQAANASPKSAAAVPATSVAPSNQQPQRDRAVSVPGVKGTTGPATPAAVDSQPIVSHDPVAPQRSYSILVGSFRYEPEAAILTDQLSGLGYRTRTARVTSSTRGTWHQVFVGPYGDLERARVDETRVRQLPGYADAHVITQ
ncbi:MAG TPA: AAA family ATPase [Vicinamibacterales bacterium]|nr:AAA family ATPase [Vicinamibacterales bacterium]